LNSNIEEEIKEKPFPPDFLKKQKFWATARLK